MADEGDDARPVLHFTAASGWINDPHGLVHVDGRYHLFYQYVPEEPRWSPRLRWGHASSTDLLSWQEHAAVLVPRPPETGCWSGSLVQAAGGPLIFYSSSAAVASPGTAEAGCWPTRLAPPPDPARSTSCSTATCWS